METVADFGAPARKLRGTFLDQSAGTPARPEPAAPAAPDWRVPGSARPRLNLRMFLFAAIVLGLLGWPIYTLIHEMVTHGISKHGDRLAVDLKAIGNFNMPTDGTINDVPAEFRALDGKRVELEGYMYSTRDASDHMKEFELVYNVAKCCFGGPPKVQERVFAVVPEGRKLRTYDMYTPARVVGTLHVNVIKDARPSVVSVYTLDVEKTEMQ